MTDQTSPQPKTSWGLGATVRGRLGSISQKMVVKTNLGEHTTPEEEDGLQSEASRRLYDAIMAEEPLRRYHRPQMIDGKLFLTDPFSNQPEKVWFETVLIVE